MELYEIKAVVRMKVHHNHKCSIIFHLKNLNGVYITNQANLHRCSFNTNPIPPCSLLNWLPQCSSRTFADPYMAGSFEDIHLSYNLRLVTVETERFVLHGCREEIRLIVCHASLLKIEKTNNLLLKASSVIKVAFWKAMRVEVARGANSVGIIFGFPRCARDCS